MNILKFMDKDNKFSTIYFGKVLDNEDPTKQGRLKVEIKEIFGDADKENLPWIYPIGYNSGVRLFNVPDKDVEVGVIFIGDVYTGFYGIGHYPTTQEKVYDDDYPNLYGIDDLQGNYLTINKETGEVKLHHHSDFDLVYDGENNLSISHPSGSTLTMDKDGNTECHITGTLKATIDKDITIKGKGKMSADIDKDSDITINGGNGKLTLKGNLHVTKNITAQGEITAKSDTGVNLSTHVHPYTWTDPGGAANTSAPKNPS